MNSVESVFGENYTEVEKYFFEHCKVPIAIESDDKETEWYETTVLSFFSALQNVDLKQFTTDNEPAFKNTTKTGEATNFIFPNFKIKIYNNIEKN